MQIPRLHFETAFACARWSNARGRNLSVDARYSGKQTMDVDAPEHAARRNESVSNSLKPLTLRVFLTALLLSALPVCLSYHETVFDSAVHDDCAFYTPARLATKPSNRTHCAESTRVHFCSMHRWSGACIARSRRSRMCSDVNVRNRPRRPHPLVRFGAR